MVDDGPNNSSLHLGGVLDSGGTISYEYMHIKAKGL